MNHIDEPTEQEKAALRLASSALYPLSVESRKLVLQALRRLCVGEDETTDLRSGARSMVLYLLGKGDIDREKAEVARMAIEAGWVRFDSES